MEFPKILKKVFLHQTSRFVKKEDSAETAAPEIDEGTARRMAEKADEPLKEEQPSSSNEVKVEVPIEVSVPMVGAGGQSVPKVAQKVEVRFEKPPEEKEIKKLEKKQKEKAEVPSEEPKEITKPEEETSMDTGGKEESKTEKKTEKQEGEMAEPKITERKEAEKEKPGIISEREKLEQEAFPLEKGANDQPIAEPEEGMSIETGQKEEPRAEKQEGETAQPKITVREETEKEKPPGIISEREKLEQEAFPLEKGANDQPIVEPETTIEHLKEEEAFKEELQAQPMKEPMTVAESSSEHEAGKEAPKSDGKIVVVIGAEKVDPLSVAIVKGIWKEHPDWPVYLTARDPNSGEEIADKLNGDFNCRCRFLALDVNSMGSLRQFRDHFEASHPAGIYILVNNSGVFPNVRSTSSSSEVFEFDKNMFEETVRSNYFNALAVCLELFPLLADDARVVFVSSRFSQLAYLHTNQLMQAKIKACTRVEQVSELMELFCTSDTAAVQSGQAWLSSPADLYVYRRYTLGSIYPFGIAKLGVNLLVSCYQRQFDEEKADKNVHINACCPDGLMAKWDEPGEEGVRTPEEGTDSIVWLALQPSDSLIKGKFVAERKVWDPLVVEPSEHESLS